MNEKMSSSTSNWWSIFTKSVDAYNAEIIQESTRLINEAIEIAEVGDKPNFNLRFQRAIFESGKPPDYSNVIPILFEAKQYYGDIGDYLKQIHYLIELAKVTSGSLNRYEDAKAYLDEAEKSLIALTAKDVEHILMNFYPSQIHQKSSALHVLSKEIVRLREKIDTNKRD